MVQRQSKIAAGERYSDWDLIGQGGTARVFKAMDHELGCIVAIKLLDETLQNNPTLLQGLQLDSNNAAKLMVHRLENPGGATLADQVPVAVTLTGRNIALPLHHVIPMRRH